MDDEFKWMLPNITPLDEKDRVKDGKYYKVYDTEDSEFFMIGKALSEGIQQGDNFRSDAIFISPNSSVKYQDDTRWCYRNNTRRHKNANEYEIEWLNHCMDKGRFVSKEAFNQHRCNQKRERYTKAYSPKKKLEKFPTHGWCSNPSKEVLKYIFENFNEKKRFKPGKMGIAWNNRSAWKIEGSSSYTAYDNSELEEFLPRTVCVDLEAGGFWNEPVTLASAGKHGKSQIGAWYESLLLKDDPVIKLHDPYPGSYMRELEEIKQKEQERQIRQALMPDYAMSDKSIASAMAMQALGRSRRKDEYTQQEAVIMKSKKKRRKLIFS